MPLHLLAICRRGAVAKLPADWSDGVAGQRPSETVTGPRGNAIRWVTNGPLAAATLPHLPAASSPLEHAAWLAAIHAEISILPMRYGSVLPDAEAVRHFLGSHRDSLLHKLVGLEGTGEIGLRVALAGPAAPSRPQNETNCLPPSSPIQYLASRRQHYEQADQLDRQAQLTSKDFVQAVHGLYREWRTLTSTIPGIVRLAFLVPRDLCGAFQDRLKATLPEQAARRYTLLGPWPPYSFV